MNEFVFDIETVEVPEYPTIRILKNRSSGYWPHLMYTKKYRFDNEGMCPICDKTNRQNHFKGNEELFNV